MKKNILHNFVFLGFAVLYDGLTLILSSAFFTSIIFNISSISVINGSIGIIGGADMPTLLFVLTKNPVMFLMELFIIFGISTAVIITVVSFKNSCSMRLCITAVGFLIISAILFILIPPQTYAISLYVLKVAIIYDIRVLYYIATATEIIIICKKKKAIE